MQLLKKVTFQNVAFDQVGKNFKLVLPAAPVLAASLFCSFGAE